MLGYTLACPYPDCRADVAVPAGCPRPGALSGVRGRPAALVDHPGASLGWARRASRRTPRDTPRAVCDAGRTHRGEGHTRGSTLFLLTRRQVQNTL